MTTDFWVLIGLSVVIATPFAMLEIFYESYREQKRLDADSNHHNEMRRLDKLIELQKAGGTVIIRRVNLRRLP